MREFLPFIIMAIGIVLIGTGAIWQITREHHERRERFKQQIQSITTKEYRP